MIIGISIEYRKVSEVFSGFEIANSNPDALVAAAVQQQWGLYELIPEQQSLEDLFIELTDHQEATAE